MKPFNIIFAGCVIEKTDKFVKYGIGYKNTMPWHIPEELQYFKKKTENTTVIMGHNTFISIGQKPLSNRKNIVITTSKFDNVETIDSLNNALKLAATYEQEIFVIGGEHIYKQALNHPLLDKIYCSKINNNNYFFDKYISINNTIKKVSEIETVKFIKIMYENKNRDEDKYINLILDVLLDGNKKSNRTNTSTISVFGKMLSFDLQNNILPIITTRKIFTRGIIEELLWFINGQTSSKILENKGVNIWKGNSSEEFIKNRNLPYKEGDCGPIYGFQWRHWGAKYIDTETDYTGQGFDQLNWLINEIKINPDSRRLILNAWNVADLDKMVLPPCHVMAQFYVNEGKLSCMLTQRSCDIGLGMPFNITSYALLTYIIAKLTNLTPEKLIYSMGDCHIYENHIEALHEQIKRKPYGFPEIELVGKFNKLEDFKYESFKISNYYSHDNIKMEMVI